MQTTPATLSCLKHRSRRLCFLSFGLFPIDGKLSCSCCDLVLTQGNEHASIIASDYSKLRLLLRLGIKVWLSDKSNETLNFVSSGTDILTMTFPAFTATEKAGAAE